MQLPGKPNPLNLVVQTTNKFVWQQRKNDKISQLEYFDLQSNKSVMPRFYGLPKICKANLPLRPFGSFVNSPTNNLSQFLCEIVSTLLKNSYSVKNSNKFANSIRSQCVGPHDIFVCFDVVSLFTFVPTDQALNLILQFLASDTTFMTVSLSIYQT